MKQNLSAEYNIKLPKTSLIIDHTDVFWVEIYGLTYQSYILLILLVIFVKFNLSLGDDLCEGRKTLCQGLSVTFPQLRCVLSLILSMLWF